MRSCLDYFRRFILVNGLFFDVRPAIAAVVLLAFGLSSTAASAEAPPLSPAGAPIASHSLWRFEFDNDTWLGSDDGYSAGWSLQWHSALGERWKSTSDSAITRWIVRAIPGLGDDRGRVVRRSWGVSQIIVTPRDIQSAEAQPLDLPWGGSLGIHTTWLAFDNERLAAFQLYLGCLGPCSFAEEVQTFVHRDLGFADAPLGWDNQLANRPLFNMNYAVRRKLITAAPDRYSSGMLATDVSAGGQIAAGSLSTLAHADVEWRVGWGLPRGFTHIPDPAGYGIAIAPGIRDDDSRWAIFFSAMARISYLERMALLEAGDTLAGDDHPGVAYARTPLELLIGWHVAKERFSGHILYHYFPESLVKTPDKASIDWINVSLEWRF